MGFEIPRWDFLGGFMETFLSFCAQAMAWQVLKKSIMN